MLGSKPLIASTKAHGDPRHRRAQFGERSQLVAIVVNAIGRPDRHAPPSRKPERKGGVLEALRRCGRGESARAKDAEESRPCYAHKDSLHELCLVSWKA